MLSKIWNIFKSLNGGSKPWQLSLAAVFGVIIGMTPVLSLHNGLIVFLALVINVNIGLVMVSWALVAAISMVLPAFYHTVGQTILEIGVLQGLWNLIYNIPVVKFTHFNNTMVMGGLATSIVLAVPLFVLLSILVKTYQNSLLPGMAKIMVLKWFVPKLEQQEKAKNAKVSLLRWQGIIVFALLAVGIGVPVHLWRDPFIKKGITRQGSEVLKNQIDIGEFKSTMSPLGVTIKQFEFANNEKVNEDVLTIESLNFSLEGQGLLERKAIIPQMNIEGINFNVPRRSPARQYARPQSTKAGEGTPDNKSQTGGLQFKSPQDILKNYDSPTAKELKATQQDLENMKAAWSSKVSKDNLQASLKDYQDRVTSLQAKAQKVNPLNLLDAKAIVTEVDQLNKRINADLENIKNLKSELAKDQQKIQESYKKLDQSAKNEFAELRKKYAPSVDGGLNLISLMLGDEAKARVEKYLDYYRKFAPYLPKGAAQKQAGDKTAPVARKQKSPSPAYYGGDDIWFDENQPRPDFLIKEGKLSLTWHNLKFSGSLQDISSDQSCHPKPAIISLGSEEGATKFAIKLMADRTITIGKDSASVSVKAYKLMEQTLGDALVLKSGIADVKVEVAILGEKELSGQINLVINQASLAYAKPGQDELTKLIAQTLADVSQVTIEIGLAGSLESPGLSIKTNLDELLAQQAKKLLAEKVKEFETAIMAKQEGLTKELGGVKGYYKQLGESGKLLDSQEAGLQNLLKQVAEKVVPASPVKLPPIKTPW